MRGSSNHKLEEEEGVALVQVAEDYENINGCKTTKQQPDHGHDNHSVAGASNKAAEEAGYSYWSSAVKKCVRAPGRVGLVVGGFVLLALLAAVATTWQVVDFTAVSSFLQFGNGGAQSHRGPHRTSSRLVAIPFTCGINDTSTCPRFASSAPAPAPQVVVDECPSYFRHMELDLEAWVASGITRAAAGALPAGGGGRARLRGDVPACVPDARRVHAVGHPPAAPPLPGARPRPGPHVQLRRHARGARRRLPRPGRRAAALPLLQGPLHARRPLPRLVLLGMAGGQHPPMGAAARRDGGGERAPAVATQGALRLLEGQPQRVAAASGPPPVQPLRHGQVLPPRLGLRQPQRLPRLQPGAPVSPPLQDVRAGPLLVGQPQVHPRLRLAGARRRHALPGLLLARPRRRQPLLAHRPLQLQAVPRHPLRRAMGQRAPGAGAAHGARRQRLRQGRHGNGLCLRLHAARADALRLAAPVQAHRAGARRGALPGVHGVPPPRPRARLHDAVQGAVRGRLRALHHAAAAAAHRRRCHQDGPQGRRGAQQHRQDDNGGQAQIINKLTNV